MTRRREPRRPTDIRTYLRWLAIDKSLTPDVIGKDHYDSVARSILTAFEGTSFWKNIERNLREFNDEYRLEKGYDLLLSSSTPELLVKPYESFMIKTLRRNVLDNPNWPSAPPEGWHLPDQWYCDVRDIVRTSLVVKYLDGVEYLVQGLNQTSNKCLNECEFSYEARKEGYYAAHVNIFFPVRIPTSAFETREVRGCAEIQVTTQLQEVLKRLLHKYYEKRRMRVAGNNSTQEGKTWEWDYRSTEFATNYLGHLLHYVEAMIVDVREQQSQERKP